MPNLKVIASASGTTVQRTDNSQYFVALALGNNLLPVKPTKPCVIIDGIFQFCLRRIWANLRRGVHAGRIYRCGYNSVGSKKYFVAEVVSQIPKYLTIFILNVNGNNNEMTVTAGENDWGHLTVWSYGVW